ncbi:beta-galactosidase [Clostridium oryzae]|uniref:Beta-galactosidase n=1 Tax=Clostridium oryzae TaxID=1450648 RepID=A0A1V4IL55_9CLOT|nr:beta-galactosidase [Clostridium oryzae]OPJ60475.1 beta-galactosidase precursor [Clostridium oryzae]
MILEKVDKLFDRGLEITKDDILFNGKPIYFWSGEMPYYRINSSHWEDRLKKIKAAGVKFITAYIPWNIHEKEEGRFDFTGKSGDDRCNVVRFIKLIEKLGMYFLPKPGPFICAEVQHGAIPDWLTAKYPEIAMKDSNNRVVGFRQDNKPLPDFLNTVYLKYVDKWYTAVYENILKDRQYPQGPIVAMQIENEFPYSTSELASPFSWGYSEVIINMFRRWLKEKHRDIQTYNEKHASNYVSFDYIEPPRKLDREILNKKHWLAFQDWTMFREYYGVKTLKTYASIFRSLGMTVPFYHNAGMLEDEAPMNFGSLSDVMWMGVNFWLSAPPENDMDAYTQGIRRLKQLKGGQINRPNFAPELNWGWSDAGRSDFLTRYTMPFLKGTNVYTIVDGNQSGTLNEKPYSNSPEPYPGSSPIDASGNLTDCYAILKRLTTFTETEGEEFIQAKYNADVAIGFYTPYNYAYVYTKYGEVKKEYYSNKISIPVGANEFMQNVMKGFIENNIDYYCIDVQRASEKALGKIPVMIALTQEIMDSQTQNKLINYVLGGGKLIILPIIPDKDLKLEPAVKLKDFFFNEDGEDWKEISDGKINETLAISRSFGEGEFIFIDHYVIDGRVYQKILDKMKVNTRYAYSEQEDAEVISLANFESKAIYLFINNRGISDKKIIVQYLDIFDRKLYKKLEVECGKKSVSIIKVVNGQIVNYSINGFDGSYKTSY